MMETQELVLCTIPASLGSTPRSSSLYASGSYGYANAPQGSSDYNYMVGAVDVRKEYKNNTPELRGAFIFFHCFGMVCEYYWLSFAVARRVLFFFFFFML
jgi:hypothetical protein